ncbi:MAG: tRNA (adenosine(37)-N6)-threonylcarbamoyltransferase complex dimerization subunit type 1 TsaB [Treponema sp.]|nr:tRNA (adenosine(37)-N6)-threonylcarbamoyltransferase complex dimerization subunit type 1 TsaB [Treponema sp.]
MKALAVDLAVSKLTVAAKNEDHTVSASYDIGMKQSETLLPAIDYVLEKAGLKKSELDYLALSAGPGSFTGLRLCFAALKAIEMAFNCPLYGISSLDAYAEHYLSLPFTIVSCIDAKKEKFYAKIWENKNILLNEGDYEIPVIAEKLASEKNSILICGSDADVLKQELLKSDNSLKSKEIYTVSFTINTAEQLFIATERMIKEGKQPLNDYDGPVYLRASEAEEKKALDKK